MSSEMQKKKKIFLPAIILGTLLAGILLILGIFFVDASKYYLHGEIANTALISENRVSVWETGKGDIVFEPEEIQKGFIFYPGAKVDEDAYAPVMKKVAEQGVLVVIVKFPLHYAFTDINAADRILEEFPMVNEWYLGGHSLGGAMGASYLEKHLDEFAGLVLLGSYSTADLSNSDLKVLSVYGSNDQVLNKESYEENRVNLPTDFTEVVIDGGNHAYFGDYGEQKGDGSATISREEQIDKTASAILDMILSDK